jgi:hypothetical protein
LIGGCGPVSFLCCAIWRQQASLCIYFTSSLGCLFRPGRATGCEWDLMDGWFWTSMLNYQFFDLVMSYWTEVK